MSLKLLNSVFLSPPLRFGEALRLRVYRPLALACGGSIPLHPLSLLTLSLLCMRLIVIFRAARVYRPLAALNPAGPGLPPRARRKKHIQDRVDPFCVYRGRLAGWSTLRPRNKRGRSASPRTPAKNARRDYLPVVSGATPPPNPRAGGLAPPSPSLRLVRSLARSPRLDKSGSGKFLCFSVSSGLLRGLRGGTSLAVAFTSCQNT